jgi:hypothetical protein
VSQRMLRKTIHAAIIVLLTTGIVSAQMPTPGLHIKDDKPSRTKEQKEYDKAIDREYQSKLKKIPDAQKKDPWGEIRPTPPPAKNK